MMVTLRISISGKPFNYKDYLATVEKSIKELPVYQGGLKEFMELKLKYKKLKICKLDNILQKNVTLFKMFHKT